MTKGAVLKAGFALLSAQEAEAVWEALVQFVENGEEAETLEPGSVPTLAAARELLDRMNGALAALAEG